MVLEVLLASALVFPLFVFVLLRTKHVSLMGPTVTFPGPSSPPSDRIAETVGSDEQVLAIIKPNRGRWIAYIAVGILLLVIAWGIALVVHGVRVRNRSSYVFTDKRVLMNQEKDGAEYAIDEVEQLQAGQTPIERLLNRGHIQFSLGGYDLKTVRYLRYYERVVSAVRTRSPE